MIKSDRSGTVSENGGEDMADAEKCPICGDEIAFGECRSCGFIPPDYAVIAAPYDLDPSNDHFGESDPTEGMFPADVTDMEGIPSAEMPDLEIPSIALPNLQSLNSLGLASAKAKPAPRIVVVRSNPFSGANGANPPPRNTQNAPKAQQKQQNQSPPPVQTFQPTRNAQIAQTVQAAQTVQTVQTFQNQQTASSAAPFVPYVQQVQQMQQASLPVRIVKGTSNFVVAHWWKFLLMAAAPTAGLFFMGYYIYQFRTDKRANDLLKAIMFGVLSSVMLVSRWDPFGLDVILRELLDIIFGDSRRRRRYY